MNCRACGLPHSPMIRCEVAKRLAINNQPAINNGAINRNGPERTNNRGDGVVLENVGSGTTTDGDAAGRTPNRRTRAAYNEYMRDYMRKKRERSLRALSGG